MYKVDSNEDSSMCIFRTRHPHQKPISGRTFLKFTYCQSSLYGLVFTRSELCLVHFVKDLSAIILSLSRVSSNCRNHNLLFGEQLA